MTPYRIPFDEMEWDDVRGDVRQKLFCEAGTQVRLVEFDTSAGPGTGIAPHGSRRERGC